MSFHFQSRHWWDSGIGAGGRSSDTHSAGAGWKISDLIIHPSNLSLQCTLSTMCKSHGPEECGGIYTGAWQEGGMWLLTALTEHHSLCSRAQTKVWRLAKATEPQLAFEPKSLWCKNPCLKIDISMRRGGDFPWSWNRMSNAIFRGPWVYRLS